MNPPIDPSLIPEFIRPELYDNFPRTHTAIAEWIACMVFILPRSKRFTGWKLYAVYFTFAALLLVTNQYNEMTKGVAWVALMGACMLEMLCMIWLCCKASIWKSLYHWAHAFMAAEFAASLEWQINCYIIYEVRHISYNEFFYAMAATYLVVFPLLWLLNNNLALLKNTLHVTKADGIIAAFIAILMLMVGNFRYLFPNTIVTELTGAGILFIRTLADFAGLLLLYAIDVQRREIHIRYELNAMDNLLNRQYEQFQIAEANNEALHRVYHDLKHQIAFIRKEQDEEKREKSLSELDRVVSIHEAESNTGNAVLDTLLTSKNLLCLDKRITMTVFADAHDAKFLNAMDLCSIFGNAIDNAIEYEQRMVEDENCRLIKVTVRTQNGFLLIRIENYCQEKIMMKNGTIATSKEDKQMHGFGIKSIRRTVEKYEGSLTLEQEDEWFILRALIPIPKQQWTESFSK